jgi:hypothetical protein
MKSAWERNDAGGSMMVVVNLNCGHRILAAEDDGGMDELPGISWKLLEDVARRRVATHAILGCDIVWAGKMFIEKYRQAQVDYAHAEEGPTL